MPSKDYICWLDLETTGSRIEVDQILEIGIIITDPQLEVIAECGWLHRNALMDFTVDQIDPVVLKMHGTSGLFADLRDSRHTTMIEIDREIDEWMQEVTETREHIPLAGSGVSHFDRPFIRRYLPLLDKRLTFWAYDVGAVRRFYRDICGEQLADIESIKPHRALDDAALALAEMRRYRDYQRTHSNLASTHQLRET